MSDELAERLNEVKEKFVKQFNEKKFREIESEYVSGDIDDKLSYEDAEKLIEKMETMMD